MSDKKEKKLGPFIVKKTLGSGAFSKVKLGTDTRNNKDVAIKIISKEQLHNHGQEELLRREVYVMKELSHPNIVQMHEVFQTSKHIYLILELVGGGDVFDRIIQTNGLDEREARHYFQQIIAAVYYCHMRGIAHRDIKPQNMLLGTETPARLRVSDFGLANLAERTPDGTVQGLMQSLCGTPDYVAPEVIADGGYDGFKADVWSLGIVLYVMFASRPPFQHEQIPVMFERIRRCEYSMDPKIPPGAAALIRKILVLDPAQRATLQTIIADPWFQIDFAGSEAQTALAIAPSSREPTQADLQSIVLTMDDASRSPQEGRTTGDAASVHFSASLPEAIEIFDAAMKAAGSTPKIKRDVPPPKIIGYSNFGRSLVAYSVDFTAGASGGTIARIKRTRGELSQFESVVSNVLPHLPPGARVM